MQFVNILALLSVVITALPLAAFTPRIPGIGGGLSGFDNHIGKTVSKKLIGVVSVASKTAEKSKFPNVLPVSGGTAKLLQSKSIQRPLVSKLGFPTKHGL